MQEREEMLLDRIWREVGCLYLSDLHLGGYFSEQAAEAVSRIPAEEFPANEWREAFCYLTGEETDCRGARALRRKLLKRMREKSSLDSCGSE